MPSSPATIGQQLKERRLARELSLEEVFDDIHIRMKYLKALEADDFSVMPSPVQGRGFLRLYAQYLDLDVDALLEERRQLDPPLPKEESGFQKLDAPPPVGLEVEENAEDAVDDEAEEEGSLWERFQARIAESLASEEVDTVQEAADSSTTESSQRQTRPEASSLPIQPVPASDPEPLDADAQRIFKEIGETLRKRREMLSLTHAEVEGHIHLRPHYLKALESGDFASLPSPVQMRGMLSNYAEFLDLDAEALLLEFAEGLQTQRLARQVNEQAQFGSSRKKERKGALGGFVAPDMIFGVGMIALLIVFTVWGLGRIAKSNISTEGEATAPSIAEMLITTPTPTSIFTDTPTVVVNTPNPNAAAEEDVPLEELAPEELPAGVEILVTILERSWLRVHVDGELVFEGRAKPNATFVYEGNESVEVLTANGAGVRIAYNQRDMGLMGGFGEVVQRIYGARDILTPTVTPTLDVTPTFTPTMTPSPTLTPTLAVTEALD